MILNCKSYVLLCALICNFDDILHRFPIITTIYIGIYKYNPNAHQQRVLQKGVDSPVPVAFKCLAAPSHSFVGILARSSLVADRSSSSSDSILLWRSSSGDISVNNESLSWSQWSAAKDHGVGSQSQWSQVVRSVWAIVPLLQNRWLYKLVSSWDSFYKPLWLTDWIQIHRPTVFLQQCHHLHHHLHLQHLRRRSCHQNMESKSFTSQE